MFGPPVGPRVTLVGDRCARRLSAWRGCAGLAGQAGPLARNVPTAKKGRARPMQEFGPPRPFWCGGPGGGVACSPSEPPPIYGRVPHEHAASALALAVARPILTSCVDARDTSLRPR